MAISAFNISKSFFNINLFLAFRAFYHVFVVVLVFEVLAFFVIRKLSWFYD
jgi:hypothetical protein